MRFARIKNWVFTIIHINRVIQQLEERLQSVSNETADIKDNQFDRVYSKLISDSETLKELNIRMSITPTVWGNEDRLDISDKAAVSSCLFNTNSGRISIGEYTYAGSRVSILAGSHDPELSRFLRRDSAYTEGLDIEIGRGVWLGSNATILGPCVIEDDAVVAAGAVVIPGTHIGKGELYGGVPAKIIKKIKVIDNLKDNSQKLDEIIAREKGLLFYSGWTEKEVIGRQEGFFIGHWMTDESAVIYCNGEKTELILISENEEGDEAVIVKEDGRTLKIHVPYEPTSVNIINEVSEKPYTIIIKSNHKLFASGEKIK